MLQLRYALFLTLVLGVLAGCGQKSNTPASVSGKVTYKGQPVKGGLLAFHSKDMGVTRAALNEDGTYELANVSMGSMKVTVDTELLNPGIQKGAYPGMQGKGPPTMQRPGGGKGNPGEYVKVPAKYADPDKTDLTVNLTSGKNVCNFDLTD